MRASLDLLVQEYRRKGVLVDTNLLVVLMVGKLSPAHLRNCRATKAFTEDDFWVLHRFVGLFGTLVTTPHILTEVSNLSGKLPDSLLRQFRDVFREVINELSEKPMAAEKVARDAQFPRFGLTDTAITMIAPKSYLVLTDDLTLYRNFEQTNVAAINFNHIRTSGWT